MMNVRIETCCRILIPLLTLFLTAGFLDAREPSGPSPNFQPQRNILNTKKIEEILGRSGEIKEGVLKISFPRTDLQVTLDGTPVKPALAMSSWVAFLSTDDQTLALGDLVLRVQEIKPVKSRLKKDGFEITALHHHLLRERPTIMFMHFMATGSGELLAERLRKALQLTSTPLKPSDETGPENMGAPIAEEAKEVGEVFGREGKVKDGVIQYSFPRKESVTLKGTELPPMVGLTTTINFQPGKDETATTGTFVLGENEVNPVVRSLRANGIEVTAVHRHLNGEEPRVFFLHFWGVGQPIQLAERLKEAINLIQR
jgi:Domain of Unknown Function (DUF1259)